MTQRGTGYLVLSKAIGLSLVELFAATAQITNMLQAHRLAAAFRDTFLLHLCKPEVPQSKASSSL